MLVPDYAPEESLIVFKMNHLVGDAFMIYAFFMEIGGGLRPGDIPVGVTIPWYKHMALSAVSPILGLITFMQMLLEPHEMNGIAKKAPFRYRKNVATMEFNTMDLVKKSKELKCTANDALLGVYSLAVKDYLQMVKKSDPSLSSLEIPEGVKVWQVKSMRQPLKSFDDLSIDNQAGIMRTFIKFPDNFESGVRYF
jgi:hypothetical protein